MVRTVNSRNDSRQPNRTLAIFYTIYNNVQVIGQCSRPSRGQLNIKHCRTNSATS